MVCLFVDCVVVWLGWCGVEGYLLVDLCFFVFLLLYFECVVVLEGVFFEVVDFVVLCVCLDVDIVVFQYDCCGCVIYFDCYFVLL